MAPADSLTVWPSGRAAELPLCPTRRKRRPRAVQAAAVSRIRNCAYAVGSCRKPIGIEFVDRAAPTSRTPVGKRQAMSIRSTFPGRSPQRRRFTILIADDDDACREAVSGILDREGHRVIEADCGRRAVEIAKNEALHLLILDMFMRDLTGLATLRLIDKVRNPLPPTIFLTANESKELQLEALDAGAFTVILKPFEVDVVKLSVQTLLDRYYRKPNGRE
jgi:CheY-like chemotaxis protein